MIQQPEDSVQRLTPLSVPVPVPEHMSDVEWSFRTLWRWKGVILSTSLVSVAAAVLYVKQASEVHLVGARLLVQEGTASLDQEARVRSDPRFVATQAEIIRSPVVVENALRSLADPGKEEEKVESLLDEAGGRAIRSVVDGPTLDSVMRSLHVVPVGSTNVIQITLRSSDATRATQQLQAIIRSYDDYMNDLKRGSYVDALRILTKQEKSLREELAGLQAEYQQLRAESSLLGEGREVLTAHLAMLRQLGDQLFTAKRARIDLESQMVPVQQPGRASDRAVTKLTQQLPRRVFDSVDQTTHGSESRLDSHPHSNSPRALESENRDTRFTADADLMDEMHTGAADMQTRHAMRSDERLVREVAALQQRKWEAESELEKISATFGPKHPSYKGLKDQIALWSDRLARMEQSAPEIASRSLDAARRSEEYLTAVYNDEYQKVKAMDTFILKEQQSLENIKRVQQIHESTLQKIEDWKLTNALADGQLLTVKTLEDPQTDNQVVWPATTRVLALGLLFGIGLGSLSSLLLERVRYSEPSMATA